MPIHSESADRHSFYVTGGTLGLDAPSYVERQCDRDLLQELLNGRFCYVLTSRQMGKSSLMVRTAKKLREHRVSVIVLDLTAIGQNLTAEQWYDGLCVRMGQQLHLEDDLEEFWKDKPQLSPVQRLFEALRDVVLPKLRPDPGPQASSIQNPVSGTQPSEAEGRLVIFVDEIDMVRSLPFVTDELFAAIRECHNRRTEDPVFARVTFCLLGVAMPSDLIQDTRMTPFNIGRRIELNDFTEEEATPLAQGLEGRGINGGRLLRRVLFWTGGHPYLTQRLCQALAERTRVAGIAEVDRTCQELFLSHRAKERDDNLIFVRERLLRNEPDSVSLLSLYRKVLERGGRVADDETDPLVSVLRLSGIVRSEDGRLTVRNQIYGRAFDRAWIENHLPEAELRRQREAYRSGLVRATTVAAGVILVMSALVVFALWSRGQAREATGQALFAQARAVRLSGQAGRRAEALEAIRQAARIRPSIDLRNEAVASLAVCDLSHTSNRLAYPTGSTPCGFSDDLGFYAYRDSRGVIAVRSAVGHEEAVLPGGGALPTWTRFSRGNSFLAAAYSGTNAEQSCLVWNLAKQKPVVQLTNSLDDQTVDFSHEDQWFAAPAGAGLVQVFDLVSGQVHRGFNCEREVASLCFHPEEPILAIGTANSLVIELHEVRTGRPLKRLHSPSQLRLLRWHPQGDLLAAVCRDDRIRLWNIHRDALPILEYQPLPGRITRLAFSVRGHLLATASEDQVLRLWNVTRGTPLLALPHIRDVRALTFWGNDHQLAFQSGEDRVGVRTIHPDREFFTLCDPVAEDLRGLDVHPEGRVVAAAYAEGISFWDLNRGHLLGRLPSGPAYALAFQPGRGNLVESDFHGVHLFEFTSTNGPTAQSLHVRRTQRLTERPGASALAFSGDGAVLAIAYDDKVLLLETEDWSSTGEIRCESRPDSLTVSHNADWIAAGQSRSGSISVWNRKVPLPAVTLSVNGAARVQFSPEGRWLAAGTEAQCRLWAVGSWEEVVSVSRTRRGSGPSPMAFSSDGSIWAWAPDDFTIRLIDIKTFTTLADLEFPEREPLFAFRFSSSDTRLVCAAGVQSMSVWNLVALGQALDRVRLGWPEPWFPTKLALDAQPLRLTVELDPLPDLPSLQNLREERALSQISWQVHTRPQDPNVRRRRGGIYKRLQRFEEALADFEACLKLSPTDAWAHRDMAWILLFGPKELRDYPKARAHAAEAAKIEPHNAGHWFRLGVACYRTESYAEALAHLEKSARLGQQGHEIARFFYQAMCHAKVRQLAQAGEYLRRALDAHAQADEESRRAYSAELSGLVEEASRLIEN